MKGFDTVQIRVKDGLYVKFYFRNKFFPTSYVLPKKIKSGKDNPYFNHHLQKLKKAYGENYAEVNEILKRKKALYDSLIVEAEGKGLDPLLYIQKHLAEKNEDLKNEVITKQSLLVELFNSWYENKKQQNPDRRSSVTEIPLAVLNNFKHFESDMSKSYTIGEIDMDWIHEFARWCVKKKKRENTVYRKTENSTYNIVKTVQLENSTLKRHLIEIRAFLANLDQKWEFLNFPLNELQSFYNALKTSFDSKIEKDVWAYHYLTTEEWNLLKEYKLPDVIRKERHQILDLFKFCCYTGLRYSDLKSLKPIEVNDRIITKHAVKGLRKKSSSQITVKMNNQAFEIYNRYKPEHISSTTPVFDHVLPSNQQANQILRKVLKEIPLLNQEVQIYKYYLNEAVPVVKKKYELLTWHSSRRTFINQIVRNGATIQQIQTATGWTDINAIVNYMDNVRGDDPTGYNFVDNL